MFVTTDGNGLVTGAYDGIEKQDGMIETETGKASLFSESGVSLFMLQNGVLVSRAQKEIDLEEAQKKAEKVPSEAERLTAVENALMEMMLGGETVVPVS